MTKAEAGRLGGLATLRKYGRDQLTYWAKHGKPGGNKPGRPRNPTYDEIGRQQQLLERNNNNGKEVIQGPPGSLTQLRRHYKLRCRSSSIPETAQAGIAQETPHGQSLPERERV